jgi:RHH-type rel operon transcriptional repressor/antitoxin RelB
MLTISLPRELDQRLKALAHKSGETRANLARKAVLSYIEELEDFYLADSRAKKNEPTIPLSEVERELGL